MAKKVVVSLMQPHSYREHKDAEPIRYPMGMNTMPLEHAKAMGVLHRIRGVVDDGGEVQETHGAQGAPAFDGRFDEKLSALLQGAGYRTLEDVSKANPDELRAIQGIGPANFERIQAALQGE